MFEGVAPECREHEHPVAAVELARKLLAWGRIASGSSWTVTPTAVPAAAASEHVARSVDERPPEPRARR